MMTSLNLYSGFLLVLLYASSGGVSGVSISKTSSSRNRIADLFEKLDLSSDPHHESNPSKSETSFSGGYGSNDHKSHHDSDHTKDNDHDKYSYKFSKHEDEGHEVEYDVVHNCREFIHPKASTPQECIFRGGSHDDHDEHDDHPKGKKANFKLSESEEKVLKGIKISRCRWDKKTSLCFCPRSHEMCFDKKLKNKCYWHEEPKFSYDYDGYKVEEKSDGECISNAERFYNVLHKLLIKRGKKDFAIRINYNSIPARTELPYGPHGPSIISYSSNSRIPKSYNKYFQHLDYDGESYPINNGYEQVPYMTPYNERADYAQSIGGSYSNYGMSPNLNPYLMNQGYGEYTEPTYNEPSYESQSTYDSSIRENYGQNYPTSSYAYVNQPSPGGSQNGYSTYSPSHGESYEMLTENSYGSRIDYGQSSNHYDQSNSYEQSPPPPPPQSYNKPIYETQPYSSNQPIYEQPQSYSQPTYEQLQYEQPQSYQSQPIYEQQQSYNSPPIYEQPQSYNTQTIYEQPRQPQSYNSQPIYEQPQSYNAQTIYEQPRQPQSYNSQPIYEQPQTYNRSPIYEQQSSNSHYTKDDYGNTSQNTNYQSYQSLQPSIPQGYVPPVYQMQY